MDFVGCRALAFSTVKNGPTRPRVASGAIASAPTCRSGGGHPGFRRQVPPEDLRRAFGRVCYVECAHNDLFNRAAHRIAFI
jgi:hypothetical protein